MHAILKGMFTYTKTDIICAATLLLIITRLYGWKKKDIFMKLYFWITFSSFCMVVAFAAGYLADSGIINMCRGLRSLTWACAFIAFNYTIFLWFIYSGIFRESSIISNRMSCLHCAIPAVINMIIIIIACFVDGFYSINDAGKFLRGKYYEFLFIIPAVYITISTAALLKDAYLEKKSGRGKRYVVLISFTVPVILGAFIQNMEPQTNMLVIGICIGVISAYCNLSVDEVAQEVIMKNIELEYSQAELKIALEHEKRQYNTVSSLANIYIFMYYIHMDDDSYERIKDYTLANQAVGDIKCASTALRKIYSERAVQKHINMMLEFTDLSTLDERMGKNEYISTEYKGKKVGWCRARFIEVDRDENGKLKHVIFAVQDISNEKQQILELQDALNYANQKAYVDGLTGVKNVTAYKEYIEIIDDVIKNSEVDFAVAIFDINGLKYVNDNYGHEKGNILIIDSCRCICRAFKHSPVFRIGGDEFVAIIENADVEQLNNCRRNLEQQFEQINEMYPDYYFASAAMGIVHYDSKKHSCYDDVFKKADAAMYENKQEIKRKPENSWMLRC